MRRRFLASFIGSLLLVLDPAIAAPPASLLGTMNSRGAVEVNGVRAPNGLNVYAGNRIVTGRGALAIVMLERGGKLALGSSTSASLVRIPNGLVVKLDRGVVDAVSEEKVPVLVKVEGVTIRARNRDGAFEVIANGRSLRVVARRGTVLAEAGNRTVRIDAGKTMKTSVAPAAGGSRGEMRTILIVAGAAGTAGLAAAVSSLSQSSKQTCVSPSQLSCP